MRHGAELLREQNVLVFDGLPKIALAEAEAVTGDPARAIAILDDALTTCDRTGNRAFEAELHRARGEILLKRDPANPVPAEEALLTAIAIAKQQATRSFELRAALSLARLYQSTGRPIDAHAVLAPALEDWPRSSLLPSGRRAGDEGPAGPGGTARKPSPPTPSRPGEFHPEPLTDPDRRTLASSGSCHSTKADAFRRKSWVPPVSR